MSSKSKKKIIIYKNIFEFLKSIICVYIIRLSLPAYCESRIFLNRSDNQLLLQHEFHDLIEVYNKK